MYGKIIIKTILIIKSFLISGTDFKTLTHYKKIILYNFNISIKFSVIIITFTKIRSKDIILSIFFIINE